MRERPEILIIGGGFSGTMVAAQLLRKSVPLNITILDKASVLGRGIAYSADSPRHLLNVPAASMSAFPDDPEHFLRWAKIKDSSTQGTDFLPRSMYGTYLEEVLLTAAENNADASLSRIVDEVVDLQFQEGNVSRTRAVLKSGRMIDTDAAVIAIGNFPPALLPGTEPVVLSHPSYFGNPWNVSWEAGLDSVKSLVVIGTGLTSADVIVEAIGCGYRGKIHAISLFGLLPQSHKPGAPIHGESPLTNSKKPLREIVSLLRSLAKNKIKNGSHWQEVMDDVRPYIQKLWTSLSMKEQRAFMRHARPYWDVHRHRVAPEISKVLSNAIENGTLVVHPAKISQISVKGDQIQVSYVTRGKNKEEVLLADRLVNCTGPRINITEIESSLLDSLFSRGLATPDELELGVKCGKNGELIYKNGTPSKTLFTIGSLRRGELWETTAVRELRVQAAEVADAVMKNISELYASTEALKSVASNG